MRTTHWNESVLGVAAAVEAVTGLFLLVSPHLLAKLLFAVDVSGVVIVIGRVAGIALLALGVGCWFGRREASGGWALMAMLLYNVLVTLYLTFVALGTEFVGVLLWPAVVVHAVLTILLGSAWSKSC
jgi:hypothetical protein